MAPLTGKDAQALRAEIGRRNSEQRAKLLAAEKAAADVRGKERFDLERLESLCDTSQEGRVDPIEERQARYEYKYYVENPEFMTLAELAALVTELGKW